MLGSGWDSSEEDKTEKQEDNSELQEIGDSEDNDHLQGQNYKREEYNSDSEGSNEETEQNIGNNSQKSEKK